MNWREFITDELKKSNNKTEPLFGLTAPESSVNNLTQQLNLNELQDELIELYKESNGVIQTMGGAEIGALFCL